MPTPLLTPKLNRRTLLRGSLGGIALGLALPLLRSSSASGESSKRLVYPSVFGLFYWGNGNLPSTWRPSGLGDGRSDWSMSEQLEPLQAYKDKVSVITGLKD